MHEMVVCGSDAAGGSIPGAIFTTRDKRCPSPYPRLILVQELPNGASRCLLRRDVQRYPLAPRSEPLAIR